MPIGAEYKALSRLGRRPTPAIESMREPNRLEKVLAGLSTGQFAAAGLFEELERRGKGLPARPMGKQILKAIKEQRSFSEITGNVGLGFLLDVAIDPINLVPGGAITKGAKAVGAVKLLKGVSKITEEVKALREIKNALGRTFIVDFDLKKFNPDDLVKNRNKHLNEVFGKAERIGREVQRELEQLVPDITRREDLYKLVESEPIRAMPLDPRGAQAHNDFMQRVAALDVNERKFFNRAKEILDELEQVKIEAGLLSKERAAGFLAKAGIPYVPRMQATKRFVLERLREIERALVKGDPALEAKGYKLDAVRAWVKEAGSMEELVTVGESQFLQAMQKSTLKADFLETRKLGRMEDLPEQLQKEFQLDLAAVLGVHSAQVAQLVATRRYVSGITDFLQKQGLMFSEDVVKNPVRLRQRLVERLGQEDGLMRFREGFSLVRLPKTMPEEVRKLLDGMYVPKSLHGEITGAITKYAEPDFLKEFFGTWARVQNIWKAHTLAFFPAYHSRNFVSNLWNNWLAGMGPKTAAPGGTYWAASKVMLSGKSYKFSDTPMIGKLTDRDIWRLAQDNRVVMSGETVGELGQSVGRIMHRKNILSTIIEPSQNPAIKLGFKFGRTVEDHARLAHFMWRLEQGKSVEEAARSVMKYLFDYRYGLTGLEQKLGRNFMFPFYAWSRFNIPLQLEMLVAQPRRVVPFEKARRAVEDQWGGPELNEVYLSEWMKRSMKVPVRYNKKTGIYEMFVLDSWWPGADVHKVFDSREFRDEILNLTSPFAKIGPELLWNYNLFTKRKISEFEGQTKEVVGVPLFSRVEHVLRNIRTINEIDRTLQTFDRQGWVGMMRPLFGRTYPVDRVKQQKYWTFNMRKRIAELKRQRKRAEVRGEKGNFDRLNKLIEEAEQRVHELGSK